MAKSSVIGDEHVLVTVIIPVFNRIAPLRRAVLSVLKQSYKHFELLIINDGSQLDCQTAIADIQDSRINYLSYFPNRGVSHARNVGLDKAKGEYVGFLDSDDEWVDDFISSRIEFIQQENADGVYGSCYKIIQGKVIDIPKARNLMPKEKMINYLLSGNLRAVPSTYFFTSKSVGIIRFDEASRYHQDLIFNIEYDRQFRFVCDSTPRTFYHDTANTLGSVYSSESARFITQVEEDITFEKMLFYILRKTSKILLAEREESIVSFKKSLNKKSKKWSQRIIYHIYNLIPVFTSLMFNLLMKLLYRIKYLIFRFLTSKKYRSIPNNRGQL